MLRIRPEQIEAFESARAAHFEPRTVQHLKERFPKHCDVLKEDGILEVIHYGIERAETHGLTHQSEVSLFIDLTLMFGRYFDTDLQLPWAAEILTDPDLTDQLVKARRLHAAAMDYLDRVAGPDNAFIDAALQKVLSEPVDIATGDVSRFQSTMLIKLEQIWSAKYDHMGEETARQLIKLGISAARSYGLKTESGVLIYIGLMYLLGAGFDRDPLFAWAAPILNDKTLDRDDKAKQLHAAAVDFLNQWLA